MMIDQMKIQLASQGNVSAFCDVVSAFQDEVYRLCYFYTEKKQTAYDLSADSFRKIWNAIPLYTDHIDFHLWLIRIVCQTCSDSEKNVARSSARLVKILHCRLDYIFPDIAFVLDMSEEEVTAMYRSDSAVLEQSEAPETPDLVSGIRKTLNTEKQGSNLLKILSHFRFTILAIVIVLILLLVSRIQSAQHESQTAPDVTSEHYASDSVQNEDTANEILPAMSETS